MVDYLPKPILVLQSPPTVLESVANLATPIAAIAAVVAIIVSLYVYWDSLNPDVVVYLRSNPERLTTGLIVENLGKSPAYNISIKGFDVNLSNEDLRASLQNSFIFKGIPMLVQGESRNTLIASNKHAQDSFGNKTFSITVSYDKQRRITGLKTITKEFTLDYYSFANSLYVESDIHAIATAVKKISKTVIEDTKNAEQKTLASNSSS